MEKDSPKFGDIYLAALDGDGCIQSGKRPVVIAQNDIGNQFSSVIEIIPISSKIKAEYMPTHTVLMPNESNGLKTKSIAMSEQTQTINKTQLKFRIGSLTHRELVKIGRARRIQSPFPLS